MEAEVRIMRPSPGDPPNPEIEPRSPSLQADTLSHQGSPYLHPLASRVAQGVSGPSSSCVGTRGSLRTMHGSFQKSVSGALEIQLHETKDCFLSYKYNEMRIRVEWRMAGSPSLPAEFYPVCMMPSGRLLTTSPVIF